MKLPGVAALARLMLGVMVTVTVSVLQLVGLMASHNSYLTVCTPAGQKRRTAGSSAPVISPYQPLTAPMVTPSRKYFWSAKNRMNIGSAESVAPAIMGANSVSFANLKVLRPT